MKTNWNKVLIFFSSFFALSLLLPGIKEILIGCLIILFLAITLVRNQDKISERGLNKTAIFACIVMGLFAICGPSQRTNNCNMITITILSICAAIISYPFFKYLSDSFREVADDNYKFVKYSPKLAGYLILLIYSFITVTFLSQSSFLYPYHFWDDSNCFLTVCRSMLSGKILYTDIYEQKGPLLYFLHLPFTVLPGRPFLGVYLMEIIVCFCWLITVVKIVSLFVTPGKLFYICALPLSMLTYSSLSFYFGDSAEELALPFLGTAFYLGLKSARLQLPPSKKEAFIIGITAGALFWIKYTFCGLYIGFIIYLTVILLRDKKTGELFRLAISFISGVVALTALIIPYFLFTNSLNDLFTVYFYNNIFLYSANINGDIPLYIKPVFALMVTLMKYDDNHFLLIMTVIGFIFALSYQNKKIAGFIFTCYTTAFIGIFGNGTPMFYYIFGLAVFSIPGWAAVLLLIRKYSNMITVSHIRNALLIYSSVTLCVLSFTTSIATLQIFKKIEDIPQYKFAQTIKSSDNRSLVCLGFLDEGFYTLSETTPVTRFFCWLNIARNLPEANEEPLEAIRQHKCKFIITKNEFYDFDGYTIINTAEYYLHTFKPSVEHNIYYLYQLED